MYHKHNYREDIAGPAWLYRIYSGESLLYVGVSMQPDRRFTSHRSKKDWWHLVDAISLWWFPSREDAFAAERVVIASHRPLHNIARPKGATV
jgi:predicted GIY-YIG superfamily endonuclease